MLSAPFMEGCWRMRPNSSSAGGQLEHPSEVNSSTTTAFRWAGGNGTGLRMKAPKTTMSPSNRMPCSHGDARLIRKYYAFFHTTMQYLKPVLPSAQLNTLMPRRQTQVTPVIRWLLRASGRMCFNSSGGG